MTKHQKLLPQRYKTFKGAAQRAAFERAMNPGEFARGDVARRYSYRVIADSQNMWRVERFIPETKIEESR